MWFIVYCAVVVLIACAVVGHQERKDRQVEADNKAMRAACRRLDNKE